MLPLFVQNYTKRNRLRGVVYDMKIVTPKLMRQNSNEKLFPIEVIHHTYRITNEFCIQKHQLRERRKAKLGLFSGVSEQESIFW